MPGFLLSKKFTVLVYVIYQIMEALSIESEDTASHCYPRQPKGFPRRAGALIKQSKAELKASAQKRISGLKQSWGLIKLCYYGHQDENCGSHTL